MKQTTTFTKAEIKKVALSLASRKFVSSTFPYDPKLLEAALTLAKRYLTADIKAMEKFVSEAKGCSLKPITTGKLAGSGFFWYNGEIRSPYWMQKQEQDLYAMVCRRVELNNTKF